MAIFLLILALLLLFPYGLTNYQSEASGKILDVPKFSKLKEECCMYNATFSSIRSASSLKMDLKKVLSIYKKMNCDGKEYYYNEKEDFTVVEYGVKKKFIFNEFYLTYGKGNSCEMDTSFKSIEMLPDDYSIDDAKREGNYVIEGDKVFNKEAYSNFLTDVENKKTSTFRIVSTTESGDVLITDLKYLADGKYKVFYDGTRDRNGKNHSAIMAYVYDHIGVYKNKLYAYNGDKITKNMLKTDRVYFLINLD